MYFFVLGSHPQLSRAEIDAVLAKNSACLPAGRSPGDVKQGTIYLADDVPYSPEVLQDRLAGTIKIGRIVGSMKKWNKEEAADLMRSLISARDGKVQFGISVYEKGLHHHAEALGLEVKKRLKADGVSSRLVTSKEAVLSSVVVEKNHLLDSGGEFVITSSDGEILIGQTETVQNFEEWSARDFGRPARNAKSGMIPPKLARMMLNLTGLDPAKSSVLDPFCGSGTILMEAYLLEFKTIYGSDLSERAINDTEANLNWIMRNNGTQSDGMSRRHSFRAHFIAREKSTRRLAYAIADHQAYIVELQTSDAGSLKLDELVDAIVTEPFLGRPQKGGETEEQLIAIQNELLPLYEKAFANLITLLKPGGVIVAAFPIIAGTPVVPKLKGVRAFADHLRYEREGQHVGRLIVRWKKD